MKLLTDEITSWVAKYDRLRTLVATELGLGESSVYTAIALERGRQDDKWGQQDHPDGTGGPGSKELADWARAVCQANSREKDNWRDILREEVYGAFAEIDPVKLRKELVQSAAVITQWIDAIDRRSANPFMEAYDKSPAPVLAAAYEAAAREPRVPTITEAPESAMRPGYAAGERDHLYKQLSQLGTQVAELRVQLAAIDSGKKPA